jgi:hypothetical protein
VERRAPAGPLIRRAVLARKVPSSIRAKDGPKVVHGIEDFVAFLPVAHFEIHHIARRAVLQMVRRAARRKPRAHSRVKKLGSRVAHERRLSFQHVDELVLTAVAMMQSRARAGHKTREIHAKAPKSEQVPQRALFPPGHLRGKGLGIVRGFATRRRAARQEGHGSARTAHAAENVGGTDLKRPRTAEPEDAQAEARR